MNFAENKLVLLEKTTKELFDECFERLNPILTHREKPSSMSVPVNFERDDDVYIMERIKELRRRATVHDERTEL